MSAAARRWRSMLTTAALYALAVPIALLFLFPYWWMCLGVFRSPRQVLADPLRLWPESFDFSAFAEIARVGGVDIWVYALNSLGITTAATVLGVCVTAMGAYALTRRPELPGFRWLRAGFLLTIMYPYMLLVIPVYIVVFKIGLLGSYAGIVLFLALGPIQFFLFDRFFRTLPKEVIEAATMDGATEAQILFRVILPMAMPVLATVALITFLINWSQWFPILVISRSPDTFTLPVALLTMNGELGASFRAIMALAFATTLPVALLFVFAQRRVMEGMAAGAVKG
ncbi:MAG: carbohydrate ABC transporter permease [Tagaea sp.]|nr:carbohydrate ABC transporter permease [Azospirillum sp.]MCA3267385.1 carbohydrate ABC transporter permease [Azospirillum sp.]MCZ8125222.1 carbohydrate ABC transporter permease [Magnetospirillum sp.]